MEQKKSKGSYFRCEEWKCFACKDERCNILEVKTERHKEGGGCPFFKTKEDYKKGLQNMGEVMLE